MFWPNPIFHGLAASRLFITRYGLNWKCILLDAKRRDFWPFYLVVKLRQLVLIALNTGKFLKNALKIEKIFGIFTIDPTDRDNL